MLILPLIARALCAGQRSLGLGKRELKARRIDDEQDVAHLDLLIVDDAQIDHRAGDVRRHHHDIGAHARIAGPRAVFVSFPEKPARHAGRDQDRKRHGNTDEQRLIAHLGYQPRAWRPQEY